MGSAVSCSSSSNKQFKVGDFVQLSKICYVQLKPTSWQIDSKTYHIKDICFVIISKTYTRYKLFPLNESIIYRCSIQERNFLTRHIKLVKNKKCLQKCIEDWVRIKPIKQRLDQQKMQQLQQMQQQRTAALELKQWEEQIKNKTSALIRKFVIKHCTLDDYGWVKPVPYTYVKFKNNIINTDRRAPQYIIDFERELFGIDVSHPVNSKYFQFSLFSQQKDIEPYSLTYNYNTTVKNQLYSKWNKNAFDRINNKSMFDDLYIVVSTHRIQHLDLGGICNDIVKCKNAINTDTLLRQYDTNKMYKYKKIMSKLFVICIQNAMCQRFAVFSWDLEKENDQNIALFQEKYSKNLTKWNNRNTSDEQRKKEEEKQLKQANEYNKYHTTQSNNTSNYSNCSSYTNNYHKKTNDDNMSYHFKRIEDKYDQDFKKHKQDLKRSQNQYDRDMNRGKYSLENKLREHKEFWRGY